MQNSNSREEVFEILGMHCAACEIWIEKSLLKIAGIERIKSSSIDNKIHVKYNPEQINSEVLTSKIEEYISTNGYHLKKSEQNILAKSYDYTLALVISILIALIFVFISSKFSIGVNSESGALIYFLNIFLLGLIASVSQCGMTVGSLILGWVTNFEKNYNGTKLSRDIKKHLIIFNVVRILSYTIFGSLLGIIGNSFVPQGYQLDIINLIITLVILLLAFNLLEVFRFTLKFLPKIPSRLTSKIFDLADKQSIWGLSLLGVFTFFIPCTFTFFAQTQALVSQSFLEGAMIMGVFAIGTTPILILLSYFSKNLSNSKYKSLFFKIIGFLMLFYVLNYFFIKL
jgi:sulfite exporter TauE/SafE/copper chaperone CopZ